MPGASRDERSLRRCRRFVASLLVLLCSAAQARAEVPTSSYSDLHWRLVGPFRGGWATAVAGIPGNPATFYFGSADGGVWKTSDAGVTWQPLFSDQGSASIGALAVAPSDARVLWVGTGQVQQRWDIVDGDGVYRSTDGGATWTHAGLEGTRHIGGVWVDPRDADVAIVAVLGHVFGPGEERGLFRTEDGGRTWVRVLYKDANTGAVDVAGDPAVPDLLYAALWQVRRHPWLDYFQPAVGPGSGIYRSTDGGRTWSAVGGQGLPTVPVGRIDLAVAPGSSGRGVLALVDSAEAGGLYRSDDAGATWTRVNADTGLASSYMNEVVTDPRDPRVVWVTGRSLRRSTDGGRTFTIFKGSPGGDDYHCLWIDPREPHRMITGADQGAVVSLNGGESWSSWYNQPTGQFYRLATDDRFPYWIYSGQQDSGTVAIASRSDYGQVTFRDWHPVGGDERDGDVPDPRDPDVVYGAGLGGRLSKWNARTGQVQNVSPWPVSSYGARPTSVRYRYSWITPLAISKRPPFAIYQAAQVVFRSTDGGQSWQTISPDLTGAVPGAQGCDGDVPVERATACGFGVVFAIAPSAVADGVVWIGTDNGRVQVTRDDGASWTDVTPPDMQDWTKVNIIDASPHEAGTAYVAADRHRLDDFRPLAWRTHDFGRTWTEIGHGLPRGAWIGVVRQDTKRPGLVFAGTSRGVHVSFDDGDHWQSLQLGLPRTGINDLLVKGDDLVVATQGRAIWALDGIEPLRHLSSSLSPTQAMLLPPAAAYRLRPSENRDTPLPPEEPRAPNPPVGALIDYILPAAPASPVAIEIAGPDGATIRRFVSGESPVRPPAETYFNERWVAPPAAPTACRGHNRFVWDLRHEAPRAIEGEYSIAAVPGGAWVAPAGAFVLPGRYEVRLSVGALTLRQPLDVLMDPRVDVPRAGLEALLAFQQEVATELNRSAELAAAVSGERKRLQSTRDANAKARAATESALARIDALSASPERSPGGRNALLTSLAQDLESACVPPTEAQRALLAESRAAMDAFAAAWARRDAGR